MYHLPEIRKAVAALLAGIATWGGTALADGAVTPVEWFGLLGVLAGVVAVFGVPNDAPAGQPADPAVSERGHSVIEVVVAAVALVILVLVLARLV